MAKRPTWPCYFNDLRGATQDWTDEEFGAYVRLLIFHWDKGYIPGDPDRRAKISDTANKHWELLSKKFKELPDGNLTNENADLIKEKIEKHSAKQSENIKNRYQTSTKPVPKSYQTGYQKNTKNLPLENENEIEDELKEGGTGETEKFSKGAAVLIVPEMLQIWNNEFPDYVSDKFSDFPALRQISDMIAEVRSIADITSFESVKQIKESFTKIIAFIKTDSLYKDFQLTQVAKYFNAISSKMRNAAKANATPKKDSIIKNNMNASKGARNILTSKYAEQ